LIIEGTEGDRHRGMLQKAGESELKHLTRWAAKEHEEELLRHTGAILERLVDERTQELNESTSMLRREVEVRKRAEAQAREALVENKVLIKEVHHRVKNNLQIISSLIDLQTQRGDDPKALGALPAAATAFMPLHSTKRASTPTGSYSKSI